MGEAIVHQEVYDCGAEIVYRVTVHRCGSVGQAAVLRSRASCFEVPTCLLNMSQNAPVEDPSERFPLAPCVLRVDASVAAAHTLGGDSSDLRTFENRIFLFTSVSWRPEDDTAQPAAEPLPPDPRWFQRSLRPDDVGSASADTVAANSDPLPPDPRWLQRPAPAAGGAGAGAAAGNAAGGGGAAAATVHGGAGATAVSASGGNDGGGETGSVGDAYGGDGDAVPRAEVLACLRDLRWSRPLVESAAVLSGLAAAPFRVFPADMPPG
eukprot:NODE_2970_length_849_cov_14.172544.p1 GENE.NODE_2970_length_849_cov_14.172544~~NODE_2970_length_849_cov_14.172544.p1  ORF type:complete len:266 (+),score=52.81 NODE_2970_length_849_cov_14.172544:3-800(+)